MLTFAAHVDVETGLLDAMESRLDRADGLLNAVGDELLSFEERAFATSGFGQWTPNDPVTVAAKGGGTVLVDTGTLLRELTSRGAVKVSADSVELVTTHAGAVMAARGARGAPVRVATPAPDPRTMSRISDTLLTALTGGR